MSRSRFTRRAALAAGSAAAMLLVAGCSGVVADDDGDGGGSAGAEVELTLVTSAIDGTPNAAVQDAYLDLVEERSDGRISFERTEAYSLCNAQEIVDCVRDGRADIGVTIPDYTPQYFPSTSVVSIPFIGQNWQAIMQSLYELHVDNADAKAMMDSNGLHHLSTWPVGRALIGSPTEVTEPSDLEGLSLRVSGPLGQQLFEDAGANIVALPANEAYEGVERGVVDGVAAGMDFPVNYKLMELLPHWTDPGIGEYSSFGMWLSADAYNGLPDDLKTIVDDAAAELSSGLGAEAYNGTAADQCPQMLEASTVENLGQWDESITEQWRDETGDALLDAWVDLASEQGLDNAQGVLDDYLAGLDEYADAEVDDATLSCVEQFANR